MSSMQYSEYLQSEHWKVFRSGIYKKRKRCQNCGTKSNLNVHHIHYRTVGKETDADVLLLCTDCHIRKHNKPKWKKAKIQRANMNFTRVSDQGYQREFYHLSDVFRQCPRCPEKHPVFYKKYVTGTTHLCIACPNSKPRTNAIPFEPDLPIRTISGKGRW